MRNRIRLLDKELNTVLIQDAPPEIVENANKIIYYNATNKIYGYNDYFPDDGDGDITEYVETDVIKL